MVENKVSYRHEEGEYPFRRTIDEQFACPV